MAQYENLKDYFQGEHLELIKYAVNEHLKREHISECQINSPVVCSLVCINDDAMFNVEIELGVSANIVVGEKSGSRSFIITLTGNLEQKFNDINVIAVRSVNDDDFPKDNLLSQFILPKLPESKKEIEDLGSKMFEKYKKLGVFNDCQFSIERLIKIEPIFFSPELDDSCLGRIMLAETDVKVDINDKTVSYHAMPGTILLNKERYVKELDGSLIITIAHEVVHWWFHQRFFKVLLLLGEDHVDLKSSTDMVALNDNMTDVQKALCIAEWQANTLAMRLAIPQSTVESTIQKIASDPSTYRDNAGDRMQACVIEFAKIYNVSPLVAKERLRQLGYDYVDGTCLEYEENRKKIQAAPFYFQPGTLEDGETFIIYRDKFNQLLRENEEFAELINSGRYIYLGYVVCMLSSKYVAATFNSDDVKLELTDYAREHTDECLIRFKYKILENSDSIYPYEVSTYLNKMPEYNEVVPESFELCDEDTGLDESTIKLIKEYNDELTELNSNEKSTLANTIIYHMKKTEKTECPIDQKELVNRTRLKPATISKICKGKTKKPDIRNVMVLCIALELTIEESYDLFEKAKYNLRKDTLQNRAYRFIIDNQYYDLDECNRILRFFNQEELPYHKGQ